MKLPQVLSHFLYQNKLLELPGIGIFSLDSSFTIPDEQDKEHHPHILQGVSYQQVNISKPDGKLIEFIHRYTGKMIPLAESDLDSYLRLGIQLLNIGKPFHFDGIGSIIKNNDGKNEFTPGQYSSVRLILPSEEKAEAEKKKKVLDEPEKEYAPQSQIAKRIMLTISVIGGIAIIAWAGYNLYKKKTVPVNNTADSEVVLKEDTETVRKPDSATLAAAQTDSVSGKKKDSIALVSKRPDSSLYKFVILATANKNHALRRYKQLDSISHAVRIATKDSSIFKVYFVIHTSPKDTLHIKDSLNSFYATKTIIEQ